MNRIVVPHGAAPGERVIAGRAESHHLLDVQRVARGSAVRVTDGAGWQADAMLVDVREGRAVLEVVAPVAIARVPERVVVLGMPKAPALEDALVMGTEAGATAFWLVQAARTPPGAFKADRAERVLRAAVTQCGRSDVPLVRGPFGLDALACDTFGVLPAARFICAPAEPASHADGGPAAVAIGPEGGWTPAEADALAALGFAPLGLGPFVLRTPTAVAAALGRLWSAT